MKQIRWLMLSSSLLLFMGSCQEKLETFTIPEGHLRMFGYGSLMSKNLIETGPQNHLIMLFCMKPTRSY